MGVPSLGQAYANCANGAHVPVTSSISMRCSSKINGALHYLWRAVEQDGNMLDVLVQSRRRHLKVNDPAVTHNSMSQTDFAAGLFD